jgi:hypothetical protein
MVDKQRAAPPQRLGLIAMRIVLALGAFLSLAIGSLTINQPAQAQAQTRAEFCAFQNSVCIQCTGVGATVPKAKCLATCRQRLADCRRTGCFKWIATGPVCHKKASKSAAITM